MLILTGLKLRDNETDILDSDDSCISHDDTLEINTLITISFVGLQIEIIKDFMKKM